MGRRDREAPEGQPQVVVGVSFTGLFKCEESSCGRLFIQTRDYLFPEDPEKDKPSVLKCPQGHYNIKFIQSIDKTPLTVPMPDATE